MTALLKTVARHADAQADAAGVARTSIPGLTTVRASAPSDLAYAVSKPLACLVLQGSKEVVAGGRALSFNAGDSLLITADVPTVSRITRAAVGAPYYSLVLELDPAVIAELSAHMPAAPGDQGARVRSEPTDAETADAALRLMRLLDRSAAMPVLQGPVVREMHYWLLAGRHGEAVRRLGGPERRAGGVARAIEMLRAEFARPLPVERLAAVAGMSASAFHHHFRAVTSLSPLQFQKQLRLIEARRLMMSSGESVTQAALCVGYESVPQFTREYGRLFGLPPARDVDALRRRAQPQTA